MIDLQVILEEMAKAMIPALEQARDTGLPVTVRFMVEGGTGKIHAIVNDQEARQLSWPDRVATERP